MTAPTLSIIINNYNYGRYLRQCVDSVLDQLDENEEMIVVDDGSTDDSRQIIASYGDALAPVYQENRGQAAALNAGFHACRGDWILFLDADDYLLPGALAAIRLRLRAHFNRIVFPLEIRDRHGRLSGMIPGHPLSMPSGSLDTCRASIPSLVFPPTSGNVFARSLLEKCMPIPESEFTISADLYLSLSGIRQQIVERLAEPLAVYREHGNNAFHRASQFYTSADVARNRIRAIRSMQAMLQKQSIWPRSPEEQVAPLCLPQLKDLLLARRLLNGDPDCEHWSPELLRSQARKLADALPTKAARASERCAIFLIKNAPLCLFRILARIEAIKKKLGGVRSR